MSDVLLKQAKTYKVEVWVPKKGTTKRFKINGKIGKTQDGHFEVKDTILLEVAEQQIHERELALESCKKGMENIIDKWVKSEGRLNDARKDYSDVCGKLLEDENRLKQAQQHLEQFSPEIMFPILGQPAIFPYKETAEDRGYSKGFHEARNEIIKIVSEWIQHHKELLGVLSGQEKETKI